LDFFFFLAIAKTPYLKFVFLDKSKPGHGSDKKIHCLEFFTWLNGGLDA